MDTVITTTAWDLIGFDGWWYGCDGEQRGVPAQVRIKGGRTLYEAVIFYDAGRTDRVRLARLDTTNGLRQINRYVDPDTKLEVVF